MSYCKDSQYFFRGDWKNIKNISQDGLSFSRELNPVLPEYETLTASYLSVGKNVSF